MTDYKKPAAAELRQKLTAIQYKVTQEQALSWRSAALTMTTKRPACIRAFVAGTFV